MVEPRQCYTCGKKLVTTKSGTFNFEPPPNIPGGTIVVENATWRECAGCGQQIIGYELNLALDLEASLRKGNST